MAVAVVMGLLGPWSNVLASPSWMAGSGLGQKSLGKEYIPSKSTCSVARVERKNHTLQAFRTHFSHRKPFVLRGVASHWSAIDRWSWNNFGEHKAFRNKLSEELMDNSDGAGNIVWRGVIEQEPFSSECPYAMMSGQDGRRDKGLLGGNFLPGLLSEWQIAREEASDDRLLADKVDNLVTPPHLYFIAGAAGSGGPLHVDPFSAAYWNAQVHGRKRWMFLSQEELELLAQNVASSEPLEKQAMALQQGERPKTSILGNATLVKEGLQRIPAKKWFGSLLPLLKDAGVNCSFDQALVEPGEIIYGPKNVYHIVLALDDAISCSEQLVDAGNIVDFIVNRDPDEDEEHDPASVHLRCAAGRERWGHLMKPALARCKGADMKLKSQWEVAKRKRSTGAIPSQQGGPPRQEL